MKYKTILADPPWQYRQTGVKGNVKNQYETMKTQDICNISFIPEISDKDCTLFLWATIPCLPDGFQVMKAWGFEYKTLITWVKTRCLGMGFWFRTQQEVCLLGIKGKIKAFNLQVPNLFFASRTKHSRKPERFFQLIDPIIPRPAIELFAREKRDGWDAWGNEI